MGGTLICLNGYNRRFPLGLTEEVRVKGGPVLSPLIIIDPIMAFYQSRKAELRDTPHV